MAGVSGPADDPASRGTDRRPLDCQTRRTLLEPDAARVASPVLRRARRREAPGLSDQGRRSRDGRSPPGSSRADEDADCNGGERLAWPDASVSKGWLSARRRRLVTRSEADWDGVAQPKVQRTLGIRVTQTSA